MSATPQISVVMGVRNGAADLRETMDSVLAQTDVGFEFIVVDDGSSDATPAHLAHYAERDRRVRVLRQGGLGLTRALIEGCAAARAEIIARQDCGDVSLPGRFARQLARLDAAPRASLVSAGTVYVGPRGERLYTVEDSDAKLNTGLRDTRLARGPSHHGVCLFRRDAYNAVGGYRAAFPVAQDLDLWMRLWEYGACVAAPGVLYQARLHANGVSTTRRAEQMAYRRLIGEGARARRSGRPDRSLEAAGRLGRSARARPAPGAFAYFLCRVLEAREPEIARQYLAQALREQPYYPRAWLALARLCARRLGPSLGVFQSTMTEPAFSIVVPTYGREAVLIETLEALLRLEPAADEILIVDQSPSHEPAVAAALADLAREGRIRLATLAAPNIPAAMNLGLRLSRGHFVLFVDDDVRPAPDLIAAHGSAQAASGAGAVAGRVIQPWHKQDEPPPERPGFPVGMRPSFVLEFFGGNVSLDRKAALALGGFDENFARAAYRFEAEFAHRWRRSGRAIYYAPEAMLHHLKAPGGGTRAFGDHLRTLKPDHAVGAYYCLLRTWRGARSFRDLLRRPIEAVGTRHHLRAPWWIPLTLIGEARGMIWAIALARRGPRLVGR